MSTPVPIAPDSSSSRRDPGARPEGTAPGPLYRERVLPGPGTWLVATVTGAAFGLILVPLSPVAAVATSILMAIGVCFALWASSPEVVVSAESVELGRARIEPSLLGDPEVLDVDAMRTTMGVGFEPLAYHCTRGWIRTGVRVPVLDPQDPAPAWVASSRRPEALALAIRAAQRA